MRWLLLIFCFSFSLLGQEVKPKIIVLVNECPPLVIKEQDKLKGLDIDIWNEIASRLKVETEFKLVNFNDIIPTVADGTNTIGIGGISITSEREKDIDFSHNYMTSDIKVMIDWGKTDNFYYIKSFIIKILPTLFYLSLFVVLCGHLLWWSEHGRDAIDDRYCPGIFEGMWLTVTTMTTVGYGDYAAKKWAGRLVSLLIMLVGITFYGWIIANMSNIMISQELIKNISLEEVRTVRFAAPRGSTAAAFLKDNGYQYKTTLSAKEAIFDLYNNNVKAVAYDEHILKYHLKSNPESTLHLLNECLKTDYYGIAIPKDSPLRRKINSALLSMREDGTLKNIKQKWLGKE